MMYVGSRLGIPEFPLALLYSDLHTRLDRIDDCDRVLSGILFKAKHHKVDTIVNLGDTLTTRGIVHTRCLDLLQAHYRRWAVEGLHQIILVGNHDQEDKAGEVHPFKVFEEIRNVMVIDRPTFVGSWGTLENVYFFPYMDKITQDDINKAKTPSPKAVFVHWGIRGGMKNAGHADTDGVPQEWLSDFPVVYSGHYHMHGEIRGTKIVYVGSPMEQDFSEIGSPKGGVLIGSDSEFHYTHWKQISLSNQTRQHFKIDVQADDTGNLFCGKLPIADVELWPKLDFKDNIEDHVVQVVLSGPTAAIARISTKDLYPLFSHTARLGKFPQIIIDREGTVSTASRMEVKPSDLGSTETLMDKYIKYVDPTLDHKHLLEVGKAFLG